MTDETKLTDAEREALNEFRGCGCCSSIYGVEKCFPDECPVEDGYVDHTHMDDCIATASAADLTERILAERTQALRADVERLKSTMRRSSQMSRLWDAEERTEQAEAQLAKLRQGIEALADEMHRVDIALAAPGAGGVASMPVCETARRLRALLGSES